MYRMMLRVFIALCAVMCCRADEELVVSMKEVQQALIERVQKAHQEKEMKELVEAFEISEPIRVIPEHADAQYDLWKSDDDIIVSFMLVIKLKRSLLKQLDYSNQPPQNKCNIDHRMRRHCENMLKIENVLKKYRIYRQVFSRMAYGENRVLGDGAHVYLAWVPSKINARSGE